MKKFLQSRRAHDVAAAALAVLATSLGLAACGGGGGGSSAAVVLPPPPATGNLTGTAGGTIAENASSGAATIQWSVSNPVSPKVVVGTTTLSTSASGKQTVTLGQGATAVALSDAALSLATVSISMDCIAPTVWDGNACTRPVLHYAETVYAVWTLGRVYKVAVGGVKVEVTNKTSHPFAFNCELGKVLDDGRKLARCVDPADGKRYPLAINPVDNTMSDFKEAVPSDVNWVNVQTDGVHYPFWAREALTTAGAYYVDNLDTSTIHFKDLNGVVTTAVAGTFAIDGSISVLQTAPKK